MEKTILSSLIVVCLLICTPLAHSKKHLSDTEQEAGVASDAQGRPCTFGPSRDECLERTSDYQSGFKHGVADANINTTGSNVDLYYIHQPGKGFADHTTAFVDGYIKGWCSITGPGSGIDVNDDENPPTIASFDCDKGLISAYPYATDWCLVVDRPFPACHA
ncbi:MAG TPA: hypothetical protein VH500_08355 [Nitrososphaeraceae archaeon]|jgi:hypothetical protein